MAPRVGAPTPETAIQVLMAACAPAAEIYFQLVEMVEMRLSTASLHVFVFLGPPASWERKGAGPVGTMVTWRDWELVAFHHLGISVTVYVPRVRATAVQR